MVDKLKKFITRLALLLTVVTLAGAAGAVLTNLSKGSTITSELDFVIRVAGACGIIWIVAAASKWLVQFFEDKVEPGTDPRSFSPFIEKLIDVLGTVLPAVTYAAIGYTLYKLIVYLIT